jgi:hypothetical protein
LPPVPAEPFPTFGWLAAPFFPAFLRRSTRAALDGAAALPARVGLPFVPLVAIVFYSSSIRAVKIAPRRQAARAAPAHFGGK